MAYRSLPLGDIVPMDAGVRDRLVTIEQLTESVGASKFPVESWATLCTTYASRNDEGGSERFLAAQLSTPATTRWEIPYRSDMDPDTVEVSKRMRLVYHGGAYDIISASEIGRREGIELITLSKAG